MDQVTLRAHPRAVFGTRPTKRLRREGLVPAVVYGKDSDAKSITVDGRELYSVLHTEAGRNALINVEIEGGSEVLAVAREVQRHPVRGEIIHLDLIQISLDEKIAAEISVEYVGTPQGVIDDGGFVEAIAMTVNILALPTAIPGSIVMEISEMATGDTLKVSDLPEIEGVEYTDDIDRPLVTVLLPRVEEELEVAVELDEDGEPIEIDPDADPEAEEGAPVEEEE
ncbi:MAG: 50S ribosomal protein L25 [bacterium]|nr:50S ribosomal protein L25 [bacterium]MCP4968556.1 50S ribosomal protein L25 [bacterium]